MSIALCALNNANDLEKNLETIKIALNDCDADMLIFGEAYLHGFHNINFNYIEDINKAISLKSKEIASLRKLCKDNNKALGFGYYENDKGVIYSSYMIIGNDGKIINNYRRLSSGWKEKNANADYREGKLFKLFKFKDKKYGIAICGDLWEDELLPGFIEMDARVDMIIWPVNCDFSKAEWEDKYKLEYKKRSEIFEKPIAFVNNYYKEPDLAKGGVYIFCQGKIINELKMGEPGILII